MLSGPFNGERPSRMPGRGRHERGCMPARRAAGVSLTADRPVSDTLWAERRRGRCARVPDVRTDRGVWPFCEVVAVYRVGQKIPAPGPPGLAGTTFSGAGTGRSGTAPAGFPPDPGEAGPGPGPLGPISPEAQAADGFNVITAAQTNAPTNRPMCFLSVMLCDGTTSAGEFAATYPLSACRGLVRTYQYSHYVSYGFGNDSVPQAIRLRDDDSRLLSGGDFTNMNAP